jgi:SNF2 family DNA or RNA helicase
MWFLDKGARLGRTHSSFIQRWFSTPNPEIRSIIRPLPHAQVEIEDRVKDICLSLKAEDWFDIKEPIVVDIPVYLPTAAREAYDSMESEMFAQIESGEVEANNAAAKSIKCLQIANGAIYTDEEQHNWQEVHSEKIQALESIVEETDGTPLLVAYHFRHDLARLKKAFPLARELDKHPSTIVDWNKGLIPMLLVHPESAGHGLNLQDGGNIIVMFGHWWNLESYQQVIERIGPVRQLQSGHNRPVYIYNIRAVDTIDGVVISRRNNKRAVQDLLLESAKRR